MSDKHQATTEQKLFEAYQANRGIRLSRDEVGELVRDDAIGTRISNQACIELGLDESGNDMLQFGETWIEFKNRLALEAIKK